MKSKKLFILVLILILFSSKAFAQDICSEKGYTILTINGMFVDGIGAKNNKENLKKRLPPTFNSEPIIIDYLYNPTHLSGIGDILDFVAQGFFDQKTDYDLVEILNDASSKISTEKVLLIGHSQGNFYANNFYDKVANKKGGIPAESIGVYAVATPSDRVAGSGKYLTSDTDLVISEVVGRVKNIMEPNVHIELNEVDFPGHSFSNIYLKYSGARVVSDIKKSFDRLENNQMQKKENPCLSAQKTSNFHKTIGVALSVADYVVEKKVKAVSYIYNKSKEATDIIGNIFSDKPQDNLAQVNILDDEDPEQKENFLNENELNNKKPTSTEQKKISQTPTTNDSEKKDIKPIILNTTSVNTDIKKINTIPPVVTSTSGSGYSGGGGTSNNSTPATTTIDKTSPAITIIGDNPSIINLNATYLDQGATALDNKDGVVSVVTTGIVDTTTVGVYIVTYTATDSALNVSTVARTVNVVNNEININSDTTAPTITIIGENTVTVNLNETYFDQGATALDNKDGVVSVVVTGNVDTESVGSYILTYTAIDLAGNTATKTRTIDVVNNNPTISQVAKLLLPNTGVYVADGLDPSRGRKYLTPFTFQIIYTDTNNDSPQNVKLHIRNNSTANSLSEAEMTKIETEDEILNDGDYTNGELYTFTDIYDIGDYSYYFTTNDKNGDLVKIEDDELLRFSVIPSAYTYIPKYSFGRNNGDGNDWQVWSFNGSNIYDWTDTYVNGYLREQFKIQAYKGAWCSQCLQRGIFTHDPRKGFELEDLSISSLESNPQNNMNDVIYKVEIQWDSTGYSYKILYDYSLVFGEGHVDVPNMNNNLWVGWDGSHNNFTTFPSGDWQGVPFESPMERTGGSGMVLVPYPVYNPDADSTPVDEDEEEEEEEEEEDEEENNDPLSITSYSLNGNQENITINPLINNLSIILNANKNVNWLSIKIEKEGDTSSYKIFYSGGEESGCFDGTASCSKVWDGALSGGGSLQNGNYKIKIHMKDYLNNDYEEYLPSIITVNKE